jgi:Ulp1 family protease
VLQVDFRILKAQKSNQLGSFEKITMPNKSIGALNVLQADEEDSRPSVGLGSSTSKLNNKLEKEKVQLRRKASANMNPNQSINAKVHSGGPGSFLNRAKKTKIVPGIATAEAKQTRKSEVETRKILEDQHQQYLKKQSVPLSNYHSRKSHDQHHQLHLTSTNRNIPKKEPPRKTQRAKTQKEPVYMDLVSDVDDDDDDDGGENDDNNDNDEVLIKSKALPGFSENGKLERNSIKSISKHLANNFSDLFMPVQRIYLGKRQYSDKNGTPLEVKLTSSGIHLILVQGVDVDCKSFGDNECVVIPWSDIDRSYVQGIKPNKFCAGNAGQVTQKTFNIAFSLLESAENNESLGKEVAVGNKKTLSPCVKNTKNNPSQYILIVMDTNEDSNCLTETKNRYNQLKTLITQYTRVKSEGLGESQLYVENASDSRKMQWLKEAEEELERHKRSTRRSKRRRQSTQSLAIGDQEGDNDTYLIYPMEEDIKDKITITNGDVRRLDPPEYLNDNIIDFKIKHMLFDGNYKGKRNLVHCYQSFFYERFTSAQANINRGYKKVETWTKNVNIFALDMLIVPVNQYAHWSVLFVLRPDLLVKKNSIKESSEIGDEQSASESEQLPCIVCLDSLSMHNTKTIIKNIKSYLNEEYLFKKCGGESDRKSDQFLSFKKSVENLNAISMKDIPTQDNNYDCGMYIIKYVESMLDRWPSPTENTIKSKFRSIFSFTPEDINTERDEIRELIRSLKPNYESILQQRREAEEEQKAARKRKKLNIKDQDASIA